MQDLNELRAALDAVDDTLAETLMRRFALTDAIGAYKRDRGLSVRDRERETAVVRRLCAGRSDADAAAIEAIYGTVFAVSRRRQGETQ